MGPLLNRNRLVMRDSRRASGSRCELAPDGLNILRRRGSGAMADKQFDRSTQDLGNIVNLGHVNVCISDQRLASNYYITGLGLTRDPFLNTGAGNMWVNVGMSQFHLPTGTPEILRGVIGLVVPDRQALLNRLSRVRKALADTKFEFRESNDCV